MVRNYIMMLIILLKFYEVVPRSFTSDEGPFGVVVHNTSSCIQEPAWFHTNVTAYTTKGRNLLRGKVVIERDMAKVKFDIQAFYLADNKVKVYGMKNQNCHNVVVQLVLVAIGMPYNRDKCTLKPVTTEFTNLDMDYIIHSVVQSAWYGDMQIRWEIALPKIRVMCLDINIRIVKPKDVKTKS